jgi:hypothetical protein
VGIVTFLAPLAGIIGAAVGVPILLSLYLLKLRRKPLKVSSILLWDQVVQDLQANVPLRWLKWSWLMLLQLAALICLIIAMARPAVPAASDAVGAARTVIVMDVSASMSAMDGNSPGGASAAPISRLDEAKRRALEFVEQLRRAGGARPEAMVIALGSEARIVQGFTSDWREWRDAIEALKPTDQPGVLDDAVRLTAAGSLAGVDLEKDLPRAAMVVFSDGAIEPSRERLPGSVDLRLVRVGPEPTAMPPNLGIVSIAARRDAERPGIARVFVRVTNSGEAAESVTLTCTVNGESAGLLPLDVPAAMRTADGTIQPGDASGTIELDRPAGGVVLITIPRNDLLTSDNAAALVLRPVSRPRILVVGANDINDPYIKARGPLGIDRFLLGVLQDIEPAELRTIDIAAYRSEYGEASTTPTASFPYDLVVFDRTSPTRMPPAPTLTIGSSPPIPGLRIEASTGPQAAAPTRFISWKRTHPTLRNVALDAVLVSPPMRMVIKDAPPASAPSPEARPKITPLAFGADGPLIALAEEPGVRGVKRLVLAFDLIRTNWGKDVSFPVFISSAVDFLTGRGDANAAISFHTGQTITVPAAAGAKSVHTSGPETIDAPVNPQGAASIGPMRLAGVYQCIGTDRDHSTLAVNLLSAAESNLATKDSITVAGRESRRGADKVGGEPPRREVWHWFILAAGVLLTIEWFIYAAKARA